MRPPKTLLLISPGKLVLLFRIVSTYMKNHVSLFYCGDKTSWLDSNNLVLVPKNFVFLLLLLLISIYVLRFLLEVFLPSSLFFLKLLFEYSIVLKVTK